MRKKYKKISVALLILAMMLSVKCFATAEITGVETSSSDLVETEDIYIDNYEDYESLLGGMESTYSQEELKDYYKEYQNEMAEYYKEYTRQETVRAKVKKVSSIEEYYEFNEYYYSVTKYDIQPITVEILEGEYAGQTLELEYLLTGDSLGNITYSEVKPGDTIFVAVGLDETTGELYAELTNTGSNVERFGIVICLGIVVALIMVMYAGKKGLMIVLIALLILDFCLVIIPNQAYAGENLAKETNAFIVLLAIAISVYELGVNKKAVKAILISIVNMLLIGNLLGVVTDFTRTSGIVFEASALAENVLLCNINFEDLYMIITLMIATIVVTNCVSKTMKVTEALEGKSFDEKTKACSDIVASSVLLLVVTLFATYIPNHLLLLTNKYTAIEVWNSEILISELVRLFVLIVAIVISAPEAILLTGKKEK